KQQRAVIAAERFPAVAPKPAPISNTLILLPPVEREAQLESLPAPAIASGLGAKAKAAGIEAALARLEISLNRVETRQSATLNAIEESYDAKARRMRGVLTDLGIDAGSQPKPSAVGGPFCPFVPAKLEASAFER